MLLMVEKGNRGGVCHAIHRYAKANNKYMDWRPWIIIYSIFEWNQFEYMSQTLPVNSFK